MGIERVFLGWDQPLLGLAAAKLFALAPDAELSDTFVVVTSSRARRLLLAELVALAEERNLVLAPPEIATVGRLPERLWGSVANAAGPLARHLAWIQAFQDRPQACQEVFAQLTASASSQLGWMALADAAKALDALAAEVAGAGLDFAAAAARLAQPGVLPPDVAEVELRRWREGLVPLQQAYAQALAAAGLVDANAHYLACAAADCLNERLPVRIVLLGVPELNALQRKAILAAAARVEVAAWIHVPDHLADRFDACGCVQVARWTAAAALAGMLPQTQHVHVVESVQEAASVAVALLANIEPRPAQDEVALGVVDTGLVPYVREQLRRLGLGAHDASGTVLQRTRPLQLLGALAEWLSSGDLATWAALVRHVDVEAALDLPSQPALVVDLYHAEHRDARDARGRRLEALTSLETKLNRLLAPLLQPPASPAVWAERLVELLNKLFSKSLRPGTDPADHDLAEALTLLGEALRELAALPPSLWQREAETSGLSAVTVLHWLRTRLDKETIPPPGGEGVELLGWLELHWEPAAHLVVLGVNEGSVPAAVGEDLFLPGAVREHLGLVDDRARLARDAYLLAALVASRPTTPPQWLLLRRNAQGDPILPSRLWFLDVPAANRAMAKHTLGSRTVYVASEVPAPTANGAVEYAVYDPPPPVPPNPPLTRLSPTGFRAYLTCPYRFYLEYVLKLRSWDDSSHELDALRFGDLVHRAVEWAFRQDAARFHSGNRKATEALLSAALGATAFELFGARPDSLVSIQIELARRRLYRLAAIQEREVAAGWRTLAVEVPAEDESDVPLCRCDDTEFTVYGRIDRIDRHEASGIIRLLDYKSGNRALTPMASHQERAQDWRSGWRDLQLPLYHHMFCSGPLGAKLGWDGTAPVQLGYLHVAADAGHDNGLSLADWDADALANALAWARAVARRIYAGRFDELADDVDSRGAFADLCLEHQAVRPRRLRTFDRAAIAAEAATEDCA